MRSLSQFRRCDSGSTAIEYGLICGLVFLAIVASVTNFASKTVNMYSNVAAKL